MGIFWKRYTIVFGIILLVANCYTFWPRLAYHGVFNCPLLFPESYQVEGAQVVGPPLYAQMQIVMRPGSAAYESRIIQDSQSNLTRVFQDFPPNGTSPVDHYLYQIGDFGVSLELVAANETGVAVTFQNKTFQGIHYAVLLYSITISSSARDASYDLGAAPCGTGLVLTVGDQPYTGPVYYGEVQLIEVIINNAIALIGSTVACIALRFYWTRSKTSANRPNPQPQQDDVPALSTSWTVLP